MKKEIKVIPEALAARNLRNKCPEDWFTVISYIRRLACATMMDGELTEAVKAQYHRKSMATSILQRVEEHTGE